jgi:NAD(P)-dependent dehydrogenase (short-subunit alcohol dehydrogenase family)
VKGEITVNKGKVILITGASSGLGKATALLLSDKGYRVFGTTRNPAGAAANYEMLQLEVRSDESVAECIDRIMKASGRIDVVINNAGYELAGAIEETSITEAKAQFETNFFGAARIVKAVLPVMRRQHAGHIVNISSLAGLLGVPFHGFYSASKFALEGYSESLSHEVSGFNIRVSLIEAGFLKTNLAKSSQAAGQEIEAYSQLRRGASQYFAEAVAKGDDPAKVADLILSIIESNPVRLRYRIGRAAVWLPRLKTLVPWSKFAKGTRRNFHLDEDAL